VISFLLAAIAVQGAASANSPTYDAALAAAKQVIARVKISVVVAGNHLAGCNITATSWDPVVDGSVCAATRFCFDHHPRDAGKEEQCIASKLDELADRLAVAASLKSTGGTAP
jgi:hypothetical protein